MFTSFTPSRWRILALLFLVRMTMAIQFQMVAALSPAIEEAFAVGLADVGVLIGLYFAPGIFLAAPGGTLGRHFGEQRTAAGGLMLMLVGGAVMAMSDAWAAQLSGRIIAGAGGVLINVLLTKMVADWFAGQEISLAMAVFVNSWPVGIALALVGLPVIAVGGGLTAAMWLVVALVAAGLIGFTAFYRPPPSVTSAAPTASGKTKGRLLGAVLTAGMIWGLYNAALAIVFSFGPQLFVSQGMELTTAGSMTSVILWCLAIVGTIAGFLADRSGKRLHFICFGNLGFALFVLLGSAGGGFLPSVIAIGVFSGVAVGSMVSLPSLVLPPDARSTGLGIFFTVYYLCIAIGPMVAGLVSEWISIAATFQLAALLLLVTVALVPIYAHLARTILQAKAVSTS